MSMRLRRSLMLALLALAPGCASHYHMREAREDEIVAAPPAGKVLVNIQRPSGYGEHNVYSVFDRTRYVGTCRGEQRFQYVCEPGEHVFIGYLVKDMWGTVSVIKADLRADKIYDMVVDVGYFKASIAINPLKKDEKRRADLADWEEDEDTMVIDERSAWAEYEQSMVESNQQVMKDFLEGEKRERVKLLAAEDHR